MKKIFLLAILAIAVCGCGSNSHDHESNAHAHAHIHGFTAYTDSTEFFLQHEGLQVGHKSCITLYATSLPSFKPADTAVAEARLEVGGKSQSMKANAGEKGVFHFDFVPEASGEGTLAVKLGNDEAHFHIGVHAHGAEHDHGEESHSGHGDSHDHSRHSHGHAGEAHDHDHGHDHDSHQHAHGECDGAHAHGDAHAHGHHSHSHAGHGEATDGKPGDVAFSKEQSWKIDFATAVAGKSSFGGTVKVAARVEATPGNFTTLVATVSGKVQYVGNLVTGKETGAGESLFYLEGSDVTENDASVKFAEAESNYEVAKADFERKKLLFADKIVSERDYQSSEAAYRQAEARYMSMKRNYGGGRVILKSPFKGYVATLLVSNGDYVTPGTPLATVQREGDMNITAELPVRYAPQLQNIASVNIELPSGRVFSLEDAGGHVQAVGSSVNSCNMIPLTLSARNIANVVPGSVVTLYITSSTIGELNVVVPRTALVEEMGAFFVFVQNSPVSFEKRSVEVGATDGASVKILKGLTAGERVVTKGAVALKLSQGAGALDPHAGHVH